MAKLGREARKRRGRAPKVAAVEEMTQVLKAGHGFILMNNKGLTLSQATALRKKLRGGNVALKVIKNTLLRRSLENAGYDPAKLEGLLKRETMIAVGMTDPVTPAKLVMEFSKDAGEKLQVKGGFLEGRVLSADDVVALSKMPGREELLSMMLGSMQAPVQNVVYALNAAVAKVVYAVDAHRRKLEEGQAA